MTSRKDQPTRRPIEQTGDRITMTGRLRTATGSVRQMLALAGVGTIIIGAVVYLFIRDLEGFSFIVLAIGGGLLLVDAVISWRTVGRAIFGRRGRYGVNTVIILFGFIVIAVLLNYVLFYLVNRPDPMGWLRTDTTAIKQFSLADQAITALENIKEPVEVTAFFTTNTAPRRAAWKNTQDLLSEFQRRSTKHPFSYKLVDPELEPNLAADLGVREYPALAVQGTVSKRTEIIYGGSPDESPEVVSEQQLITALLVVNQIKQKTVMFISGHSERDITDGSRPEGYGLAVEALLRENYSVLDLTLQELASVLREGSEEDQPAVIVLADPQQELQAVEEAVLVEYARRGGSMVVLAEPDRVPSSVAGFLSRYGLAFGTGHVADTASFVAPNPFFLQIKKSNGQIPAHRITDGFDVLYFPGAGYLATTVTRDTVPITSQGRPYVAIDLLASTTLSSWSETDPDTLGFNQGVDPQGPFPVAIAAEAISELAGTPEIRDGKFVTTNIVVIGDADFASNQYFASAKNGDMLVNSVNWVARDYELISVRPKLRAFRELVLTQTERDFIRWTGWLLMPTLIGMAGVWAWWIRR
ncbi:MAG: hypothetical protein EXR44_02040 [Dehalococcoidia bacterium]|nr:hypothetical protein [Dehalococcoidia bacterium]